MGGLYDYEQLMADNPEITFLETDLSGVKNLKGLYHDGCVAIERTMTTTQKTCVTAEEVGHHTTTSGDILDQEDICNRKQERIARGWAAILIVSLEDLISAFEYKCRNRYEMAEYLDVTEEFLEDTMQYYREKHGTRVIVNNYIIFFEPCFAVARMDYVDE